MRENYLDLALDEVFQLVARKAPWPNSMSSTESKVQFIRELIEYYEGCEDYEKCKTLSEVIHELEN